MSKDTHILLLEDTDTDAVLIERELRKANLNFSSTRVQTREAFLRELTDFAPDVVLSDYGLLQFNGLEAFRLLQQHHPGIPFILVTGSLPEEVAVACMKEGMDDYILKTSLKRLPAAIVNALERKEAARERERAEAALRHSEAQYRLITENTRDLICLLDLDGSFTYASPSFREVLGYAPEELIGRRSISLVHPDDQEVVAKMFRQALFNREGYRAEFRYRHRNGQWRVFESVRSWVCDERGDPHQAVVVSRDLSERREAEAKLRAQQEFLRQVIDTSPDLIFVKDWEGRFTLVNQALAEVYGTTVEGLIGKSDADFNSNAEEVESFLRADREVMETASRKLIPEEPVTHARTGQVRWFQTTKMPLAAFNGQARQVLGVATDITARKQAEAERDVERQRLNALIDQLPVGVLFRDTRGRFIRANQAAGDILGMRPDELVGLTVDELAGRIHATAPDGTPLSGEGFPSSIALQQRRKVEPFEILITTPAGSRRRITAGGAPVAGEGGRVLGTVTVIADVTEQHLMQEQLRQSQKMESVGVLAGGVAHDFNNLLTAILGNAQLASYKLPPGGPVQEHLAEIEKAGDRAAALTRQLLAFSRRQHLERRTINLTDTIKEMTRMLRRIIGEDVEVRVHGATDLSPVFADPGQIEQVILNLAVNARDAMPEGGQFIIETRNATLDEAYLREHPYAVPGTYAQITVSDTGTGMDQETRARIFEPFFTTKEVGKGTGLGLAMAYGIIKQHEGLIEVYSEVGYGTTFKIYLPATKEPVEEDKDEGTTVWRGGTETILVAEDEESLRNVARNILEELGYRVLLAKDGEEAVEAYLAHAEQIDLLMLDVVMPRLSGPRAYEQVRAAGGDVPVIFMTGYSEEIVQHRFVKQQDFLAATGAPLLQKPYGIKTLGRKVREVLDANGREGSRG